MTPDAPNKAPIWKNSTPINKWGQTTLVWYGRNWYI
jgi:hypothetical protein